MALMQISEPGQTPDPHQRRYAIGIDLGTTHSLVATVRHGLPESLPDEQGRHLLPSVVHYRAGAEPVVGYEALEAACHDPLNTVASVKRLMGRGLDDVRRLGQSLPYRFAAAATAVPRIVTAAGERSAVEVSADILRVLRRRAEAALAAGIDDAVITVPAYFDDAQRQATKDAARLSGLNVLRLLNEPTAAAVAYGLDRRPEGVYVIYDLGGGTFDVSLLRLQRGVFEVLATAGDSALGGDDMDHVVAEWIMHEAGIADDVQGRTSAAGDRMSGAADADHGVLRGLLREARRAKEALTRESAVNLDIVRPDGSHWQGRLERDRLEQLIDPLIERTVTPCRRVLRDAGLKPADIDGVVLVGGATRVPQVRERVARIFSREPLTDIDPDRVVAIGAAIQADILAGNRPDGALLLLDVLPLSLGIEIMGGLSEKIIPRNTPIPVARAQEFTTYKDGQTALLVHVVQGERELVSDCRSLARFELRGIPPLAAGAARIRVTFQVDADGLLSVAARELSTGRESHVDVKPSYGLTDAEIEGMLRDAIQHAREDESARALREAQVDADRLREAVEAALRADGETLLSAGERASITQAIHHLREVAGGVDRAAIRRAREALEAASGDFAQRRMDRSIREALTGQRLDEVARQLPDPRP